MRLLSNLSEHDLRGRKCLVRCNLDIASPALDSLRIQALLPTLRHIIERGGIPIVISHKGRPQGVESSLSLKPAITVINKVLKANIEWRENLRFDPREMEGSIGFAKELAEGMDMYINDDFATCHRPHTSLVAITKFLPSYAGLRLAEEIKNLTAARDTYKSPRVVILGGIKIEDKIGVIQNLANQNTQFLLGSAYHLPRETLPRTAHITIPEDGIGPESAWYDIGSNTIARYTDTIKEAKTVLWSGPVGQCENKKYRAGSRALYNAIIKSKAFSVAGGGDTADFLEEEGITQRFSWVSIGGGAMLAFLAGQRMPGLEALS